MAQDNFRSAFMWGYRRIPIVIRTIITLNVAIYIIQVLGGTAFNRGLMSLFAFYPDWSVALFQPWRLVTYMFLHGSGFHLLFNMLWLWWMGRAVEENLGPRTFSVIYFGAGIGGVLLDILISTFLGVNFVIGASGAVFGVMVAFAVMFPSMPIMLFLLPPIEARFLVAGLIAFDLLFLGAADNIARVVHLGGAGCGWLLIRAHYAGYDLSSLVRPFERLFRRSPTKSSRKNKRTSENLYSVRDVEIMEESDADELDLILEKIAREGYEGLTDDEKRKLFDLSKRN
ncbi:MAG: rhomboid family intramembrane serine protease [Balneolaceae bacterium]